MKALFLILVLAAGLRFATLTFDSLWLDEGYQTIVESCGHDLPDLLNPTGKAFLYDPGKPTDIGTMLANFRKVDPLCPPLFATIMNRWLDAFGNNDYAVRALPALCSLLSILFTYIFGYLLLGKRAGICAAILQTISPFDIAYAQEVRMYSLCTLFATLSGGSLFYLCLKKYSPLTAVFSATYIISTWALINTHYTQLFVLAFYILIGLAFSILRKDWTFLCLVLFINLCILGLSLPWLPLFLQAASLRTASFYVSRPANLFWPFWALFVRIPFNWICFLSGKKVMFWAFPLYFTSSFLLIYTWTFLKQLNRTHRTLCMLFAWAVIPALAIWLLDVVELHRVIEISRYLIGTAPPIYLLAGYTLSMLASKSYFLPFLLLHSGSCLANNAYMHIVPQRENWRSVAQLIENNCQANDLLFVSHYYNIVCLDRYLHRPFKQIGISPSFGANRVDQIITAALNKATNKPLGSNTFWMLSGQEGDAIFNIIPARFRVIQQYDFPHAIHLRKYKEQ